MATKSTLPTTLASDAVKTQASPVAGGVRYLPLATPQERAKAVDLITLPEDIQGCVCSNCLFVDEDNDYCKHPDLMLTLKDGAKRMVCARWSCGREEHPPGNARRFPLPILDSDEDIRARKAQLITLPKGITGTNCSSCSWQEDGFCSNPLVLQGVSPRLCCNEWTHAKALPAWEPQGKALHKWHDDEGYRTIEEPFFVNKKPKAKAMSWLNSGGGGALVGEPAFALDPAVHKAQRLLHSKKSLPVTPHAPTLAVDFDGTIAEVGPEGHLPLQETMPREGAIDALRLLRDMGWQIIIWTVRDDKAALGQWLRQHGIDFAHINYNPNNPTTSPKIAAHLYIDDRAVPANKPWDEILQDVLLRSGVNHTILLGHSGVGKSTVADMLGAHLGLPVHHLDNDPLWRNAQGLADHPERFTPGSVARKRFKQLLERICKRALALPTPHVLEGCHFLSCPHLLQGRQVILLDGPEELIIEQRLKRDAASGKLERDGKHKRQRKARHLYSKLAPLVEAVRELDNVQVVHPHEVSKLLAGKKNKQMPPAPPTPGGAPPMPAQGQDPNKQQAVANILQGLMGKEAGSADLSQPGQLPPGLPGPPKVPPSPFEHWHKGLVHGIKGTVGPKQDSLGRNYCYSDVPGEHARRVPCNPQVQPSQAPSLQMAPMAQAPQGGAQPAPQGPTGGAVGAPSALPPPPPPPPPPEEPPKPPVTPQEENWQTSNDPGKMLSYWLPESAAEAHGGRKLKLFAAAACRAVWPLLSEKSRKAVEIAQRYADTGYATGDVTTDKMEEAIEEARQAVQSASTGENINAASPSKESSAAWAAYAAAQAALEADPYRRANLAGHAAYAAIHAVLPKGLYGKRLVEAETEKANLLRSIFGNPYQPTPKVDPSWLQWENGTVPKMAKQIYSKQEWDALPILADALEEAGCDNQQILQHLRDTNVPHARGDWVLDLLVTTPSRKRDGFSENAYGNPLR